MKSCERKLKLRSHNTSYCLIEVVTKAGLIVFHCPGIFCGSIALQILVWGGTGTRPFTCIQWIL